jgi:hypothetical protein
MERHVIHKAEAMNHLCGAVGSLIEGHAPSVLGCLSLLKQQGMIAVLDPKNIVTPVGMEHRDTGRIGT